MPIQGFTRFRKHQFGRQAALGTAIAAKRAHPFTGVPDVNLNWTDHEGDVGSIDLVAPPTRRAPDITAPLSNPSLAYNDLPLLLCGFFGGGDTPAGGGASKTWTTQPGSLTADAFDLFTYQFGDDVTTDWFQLIDGIIRQLEITGPEGLGPLQASAQWLFGAAKSTGSTDHPVSGTVPTAGLAVDAHAIPIYLKDMTLYIDSDPGDIGTTPINDAVHGFRMRLTQEIDKKMFAPAPDWDVSGYGRGPRVMELELQLAKTSDTVGTDSEADAWMSETAVDRMVRLAFESSAVAEAGSPDVPYSWEVDVPMRYYTRADGNSGRNSMVTLMGRAFLEEATLDYAFKSTLVNTLASTAI